MKPEEVNLLEIDDTIDFRTTTVTSTGIEPDRIDVARIVGFLEENGRRSPLIDRQGEKISVDVQRIVRARRFTYGNMKQVYTEGVSDDMPWNGTRVIDADD